MGAIMQYDTNVFTNVGQSTVEEFAAKLNAKAKEALSSVPGLIVYAGYHGTTEGDFDRSFTPEEWQLVEKMASGFNNVTLMKVLNGMTDDQIYAAASKGDVFFTWCDSDTKVNQVMADKNEPLKGGKALL